ncbi:MAG: hypothetical protein ACTSQJ_15195 [Promethearchaeota archaeon]
MKKTQDIIRKATKLKNYKSEQKKAGNLKALNYAKGQIEVLEYIINGKTFPKDMEEELKEIYKYSIKQYRNWNDDNELLFAELKGAADVLAWVLDVPEEMHKKNKASG